MVARARPRVRLVPMAEAEFRDSLRRSIERHAGDYVRRGLWSAAESRSTSEREFGDLLPQGRATRYHQFRTVVAVATRRRVGETWYTVRPWGGKPRFWIDWIWIDPEFRRKGYAGAAIARLEAEAARLGADRVGLSVWFDNPDAIALYTRIGFTPLSQWMTKPTARRRSAFRPRPRRGIAARPAPRPAPRRHP